MTDMNNLRSQANGTDSTDRGTNSMQFENERKTDGAGPSVNPSLLFQPNQTSNHLLYGGDFWNEDTLFFPPIANQSYISESMEGSSGHLKDANEPTNTQYTMENTQMRIQNPEMIHTLYSTTPQVTNSDAKISLQRNPISILGKRNSKDLKLLEAYKSNKRTRSLEENLTSNELKMCFNWLQTLRIWPNDQKFLQMAALLEKSVHLLYCWAFQTVIKGYISLNTRKELERSVSVEGLTQEQTELFIPWLKVLKGWPSDYKITEFALASNSGSDLISQLAFKVLLQGKLFSQLEESSSCQLKHREILPDRSLEYSPLSSNLRTNLLQGTDHSRGVDRRRYEFLQRLKVSSSCSPTEDESLFERRDDTPIQCTFQCGKYFSTTRSSDWKRHELLHFPQEMFVCLVSHLNLSTKSCKVCGFENADAHHVLYQHPLAADPCSTKDFSRRYNLRSHLKSCHKALESQEMETLLRPHASLSILSPVPSWCGFCSQDIKYTGNAVQERFNHITHHFVSEKKSMKDWSLRTLPSYISPEHLHDEDLSEDSDSDMSDDDEDDEDDEDDDPNDGPSRGRRVNAPTRNKQHSQRQFTNPPTSDKQCLQSHVSQNSLPKGTPRAEPEKPTRNNSETYMFEVADILGKGCTSTVYKLVHRRSGFTCAMKEINQTPYSDENEAYYFEIQMLRRLNHPNIVRSLNLSWEASPTSIFLYPAADQTLKSFVSSCPKQVNLSLNSKSLHVLFYLAKSLCSGVSYMHDNFVLHCDLKPENIIVHNFNGHFELLLCDLGSSRLETSKANISKSFPLTPKYCPPEVIQTRKFSRRSDVFSLGLILMEMFSWLKYDQVDKASYLQNPNIWAAALNLSDIEDGLNALLEGILLSLHRDPRLRPSANQLYMAINACSFLLSHGVNPKTFIQMDSPMEHKKLSNKAIQTTSKYSKSDILQLLSKCHEQKVISSYSPQKKRLKKVRLIDCQKRRLILAGDQDYLALSYVWSDTWSSNYSDLDFCGSNAYLPSKLPPVIEDAMWITRELGWRYLWVDRICIKQHDPKDCQEQIVQMGDIYSGAVLTIVALSSDCSTNFKSSNWPNMEQTSAEKRRQAIEIIQTSTWYSRGWTYQEMILSERNLFCADQHLLWTCKAALQDVCDSCQGFSKRLFGEWTATEKSHDIFDIIKSYSQRKLTFAEDRLHACLGLLDSFCGKHLMGVPILSFPTNYSSEQQKGILWFALGLCWDPASPEHFERNTEFPSWSWVGWFTTVRDWVWEQYYYTTDHGDIITQFKTSVVFILELYDGGSLSWDSFMEEGSQSAVYTSTSCLHISAWVTRGRCFEASKSKFYTLMQFETKTIQNDLLCIPFVPHHQNFDFDHCLAIHIAERQTPLTTFLLVISEVNGGFERIGLMTYTPSTVVSQYSSVTSLTTRTEDHLEERKQITSGGDGEYQDENPLSNLKKEWQTIVLM